MDDDIEHKMDEPKSSRPPFYNIVDTLFNGVMNTKFVQKHGQYFKERPDVAATMFGAAGTGVVLESTQLLTEKFLPHFYHHGFKNIEEICIVGLTVALGYLEHNGKLKQWADEHPTYVPGMIGCISIAYTLAATNVLLG